MRRLPTLMLLPIGAAVAAAPVMGADYLTAAEAQRVLFAQADAFVPVPMTLSDAQAQQIKAMAGVQQRDRHPKIWKAVKGGATLGFVFIDDVIGKHEFITYATAISPDGHVLGVEIMSYRETHGGEIRDAKWRAQFRNKTLADPFKLEKDVSNISGATLSCRNVTDGVKRLLVLHKLFLSRA
jgi:Na+-translocating ferredoxin:NAD+ oxidoreductase RnfG subunit